MHNYWLAHIHYIFFFAASCVHCVRFMPLKDLGRASMMHKLNYFSRHKHTLRFLADYILV